MCREKTVIKGAVIVASVISEYTIIMSEYSKKEYADMHKMYGQEHENACLAQQMSVSNF